MAGGGPERWKRPDGNQLRKSRWRIPGEPDRGSRRLLLIALGTCLCVAGAGVAFAVFASPGGKPAGHVAGPATSRTTPNTPAAQPTAVPEPSATTVKPQTAGNGLAKSVLRWPSRLDRQIRRWEAGPGGEALAAVEEQMGSAMQTAGLRLYPSMKQSCVLLASEIRTAQAGPPIPDGAMQHRYAKALAGLLRAAADCRTAISVTSGDESVQSHVNRPLLNRSRSEFAATSKTLYTAIGAIEALRA